MKKINNREYGDGLENFVAEKLKEIDPDARRNPTSGSSGSKSDVINTICQVECKRRNTKDFTIKESVWIKLCAEVPYNSQKFPIYVTANKNDIRLVTLDIEDFFRILRWANRARNLYTRKRSI